MGSGGVERVLALAPFVVVRSGLDSDGRLEAPLQASGFHNAAPLVEKNVSSGVTDGREDAQGIDGLSVISGGSLGNKAPLASVQSRKDPWVGGVQFGNPVIVGCKAVTVDLLGPPVSPHKEVFSNSTAAKGNVSGVV